MADDREELAALRRLAELEQRAGPQSQREIYEDTVKRRGWGTGVPQFAYDFGGKVTDLYAKLGLPPEYSAAQGYATNVLTQALPSLMTASRIQGAPQASLTEAPAKYVMQTAVKPAVQDLESGAADKAITTMLQEGINPTRGGMDKARTLVRALNQEVEPAIAASNATVNVPTVGSRLRDTHTDALTQVNPQSDLAAVRAAWDEFKTSPLVGGKIDIPVQLAHALKKGTYQSLGNKAYGEIGTSSVEAQKALARGLREEVANAVPSIVEPLKREAALMNVRDVAGRRALLESNKNTLGLSGLRMDDPLSAATFWADKSALLKAILARGLYSAGQAEMAAPVGIGAERAYRMRREQVDREKE